MFFSFLVLIGLVFLVIAVAIALTASEPPPVRAQVDVFGFSALRKRTIVTDQPQLLFHGARDGEALAYRLYESSAERILIFMHGSSYHGAGYHELARSISVAGIAKVVLPNARGHYLSGSRRGDVDYIGQLEDDIADLIGHLRATALSGPIMLGGHSSGGGFAIRFAGGRHAVLVVDYLLLSPVIPVSPAMRDGAAGGWATMHLRRLFGLLIFNAFGISGFNALPIIAFNKPCALRDGTETLAYSHRLNASMHPRHRYARDLAALDGKAIVLIGDRDEAIDAVALRGVFESHAPRARVTILPGVDHFGIFSDCAAISAVIAAMGATT
jgi:pimeloyl-ACP methyl ester carboxylesterase